MRAVGIRELSQNTSRIVQEVRQRGTAVNITHHGQVVARLIPVDETRSAPEDLDALWVEIDDLAAEIARRAREGVTVEQIIEEERRF